MPLSKIIICAIICFAVVILILFPESRVLFRAFGKLFFKDMSATPEGAEALFEEKIDEAQEAYNKASSAYKRATGKLETTKRDLENLKIRLKKAEADCETFVKTGQMGNAQLKAEEREEIMSDIRRVNELIKAYTKAEAQAKEAHTLCEQNLRKLKREKKEVVENMKVKRELNDVYEDMDELHASTTTDKLLESVREKNRDLNTLVEGSRIVHENKLSTRLQRADEEARKLQSNDYLDSLKAKYNK